MVSNKKEAFERNATEKIGTILFRLVWWNYLDPSMRSDFANDLLSSLAVALSQAAEVDLDMQAPDGTTDMYRDLIAMFVEHRWGVPFSELVPDFHEKSFDRFVENVITQRNQTHFNEILAHQYDVFTGRIINLNDDFISAVKLINEEFMIWVATHPKQLTELHPDAFEQLTGEILSQYGFSIEFTGRIKNQSADLMAIQLAENDQVTKYLVECKRYAATRKVGLHIVNAVIGASFRAKTSHAMLVTSSEFTSDAISVASGLDEFNLELHDGERINEWLADYELNDFGLWLPDGWQDSWRE